MAEAQRTATARAPLATLSVRQLADMGPYRFAFRLDAAERVELARDRRLLSFEIVPAARGRALRCSHPGRARPSERTAVVEAGQHYAEWLDLREYCSGAALDALHGEVALRVRYGATGGYVARAAAEGTRNTRRGRQLAPITLTATFPERAASTPSATTDARLRLTPTTSRNGHATFVVTLRSTTPRLAYVRADRVRFEVTAPDGTRSMCDLAQAPARPSYEQFRRIDRGVTMVLDAASYCTDRRSTVFRSPGIYEVTPILDLEFDGADVGVEALTGTLRGEPSSVRTLGATYVEQRIDG